ncbi:MAG: ribonuclease HI family protein [candidate division WOR-3 bacterium]
MKEKSPATDAQPYTVQVDGSSRNNPGPAGIGVAVIAPDGQLIKEISRFIGIKTNNQAEYEALITALTEIKNMNIQFVTIQTDSELLYYQLTGKYSVKSDKLKPLYQRAKQLLNSLSNVKFILVPRKCNRLTDKLAKKASSLADSRQKE